tara:strand:- start:1277 stop:1477 length:201 start_codon:yes stop_codon:yes gene_type:complete
MDSLKSAVIVSIEGVFRTRKDAENFIEKQKIYAPINPITIPKGIKYSIECHNIRTCNFDAKEYEEE